MKFILSINKTINILVIVSMAIILCHDLWWHTLPELFEGGQKLLSSIYNLTMGYLVSYVFYLVVVRYKEYKDENYINSVALPIVKEVIKSSDLINDCIKGINSANSQELNNKESLKTLLNQKKYNDNIPRVTGTFLYAPASWADFLEGQKQVSRRNIQRAFSFISHLEPELIELLTSLDDSSYFISLVFVSKYNTEMLDKSMEELSDSYFDYNQTIVKLNEYVVRCSAQ